ncbi:acyloxyacyl hydrolase [Marinobacter arenosus]|uniref:acyloxyacyl hydrolase n=1 Tax=Marinobacter arenosus TaxID=2856822 RepID=UPI001C4C5DCD|nr:acyloxyacyl hydrolase [Marinobacter arenosus]MBW0149241.1 acyloxyacyl hydrolase [Marinobacter arenosus]
MKALLRTCQTGLLMIGLGLIGAMTASGETLSLSGSYSPSEVVGGRLSYRPDPLPVVFPAWLGTPTLFLEFSLNTWVEYRRDDEAITSLALSPVMQWPLFGDHDSLFLEAGIGLALIDFIQIAGHDLSSHFQFEDRIGLSWAYRRNQKASLSLNIFHYSNAGLKQPNQGLNLLVLGWSYRL